jgi:hypothetical protein
VPQAVVDALEVVEVEEHQGHPLVLAPLAGEGALHPLEEEGAVGQAGEVVVEGLEQLLRGHQALNLVELGVGDRRSRLLAEQRQRPKVVLGVVPSGAGVDVEHTEQGPAVEQGHRHGARRRGRSRWAMGNGPGHPAGDQQRLLRGGHPAGDSFAEGHPGALSGALAAGGDGAELPPPRRA